MSMKSEIPQTEQGLILYLAYCRKQIKANERLNAQLRKEIEICEKRIEAFQKAEVLA